MRWFELHRRLKKENRLRGRDSLFPNFDDLDAAEHALSARLDGMRRRYAIRNASAEEPSSSRLNELREKQFDQPEDLEPLMDWVIDALDKGSVQMTHTSYLGLFNPAPSFASECADRIASMFNTQICVYSHAPAAVEIEQHVINELARRAGLPSGSGGPLHQRRGGGQLGGSSSRSSGEMPGLQ